MPRVPSSPSTPPDMKPYLIPSSSRDSAKTKASSVSSTKGAGRKTRPWTDAEKVTLFEIAVKGGASIKAFEGKIEGRTGHQCYVTWHNTIEPSMKRYLGCQGKKST